MTTPPAHPHASNLSSPAIRAFLGPALIAFATLSMLAWSWNTWPDPLVDFGTQLYVPWQLTQGKVLYRDIAYYNGPLTQYFNALCMMVGGVGLHTLELANFAILIASMVLTYRLALRASGPIAATAAGLTFALIFAFGQGVGIGNFNWITPYRIELTHGTALALLCIACIDRFHRNGRTRWLIIAGLATGLTFLTKAEPFLAVALAATLQLASGLWSPALFPPPPSAEGRGEGQTSKDSGTSAPTPKSEYADLRHWLRTFSIFGGCALAVPLITIALLTTAMPLHTAITGVAGSWPWVFDTRITSLPFYRRAQGFDDIPANLRLMLRWTIGYAFVVLVPLLIALRTRSHKRAVAMGIFLLIAGILASSFFHIDWNSMTRPLPLCVFAALIAAAIPVIRRKQRTSNTNSLRLALVVFALAMMAKILLSFHVFHYGFVLAMPGTLVLAGILAQDLPDWIDHRGGSGSVLRAAALACALAGVAATFYVDAGFFGAKHWTVATGPDTFRGAGRALEVQEMTDVLHTIMPPGSTLEVFPEGLMINYLARRQSPTPYINFMPPEVLAAGEDNILTSVAAHPPDAIVINSSAVRDREFTLDSDYTYGKKTYQWIQDNYTPVPIPGNLEHPNFLRLVLMLRKNPARR